MTMQMLDSFLYKGKRAEAIAISHRVAFTPEKHFGLATVAWGTSNYRGFWCDFDIEEKFVLSNLYLFSKTHDYPAINGKKAENIPEFVRILEQINSKAKEERRYTDGFPMQYRGIDYIYEYSGRIVFGIEPVQNKSGKERYQEVRELLFDKGALIDEEDITAPWNAVCEKQEGQPEDYWWEAKDNNYFDLMNYAFMGMRSEPDG